VLQNGHQSPAHGQRIVHHQCAKGSRPQTQA
jgi:hypothetical protein